MRARRIAKWLVPFGLFAAVALSAVAWHRRARPEDQFAQALAALEEKRLDRVSEIQRILEDKPKFREHARLLRGAVLLRTKKYGLAYDELASIVPSGELREPALELTGECLYLMGRLSEAEPLLRQLAHENPEHANAHRWLGGIYYDLGANDAAIAHLKIFARLSPKDYISHWLIGLMYYDFERFPQAIEHYRKALARSPSPAVRKVIVKELVKSHISKRDYKTALAALAGTSRDAYLLALESECYWSLGQSARANQLLEQARSLNPDERAVLFLKARILLGDGRREEAIDPLEQVLCRNPHDADCRYQLALIHSQLGRSREYERESARWKKSKALWTRLTKLNIQALRRPRDAAVRDDLADVCEKLGKDNLAVMWRRAARDCREFGDKRKQSSPFLPPRDTDF